MSVLEAFEELGLDVRDANVSCVDRFHFEAVGSEVSIYGSISLASYTYYIITITYCIYILSTFSYVNQVIKVCMFKSPIN